MKLLLIRHAEAHVLGEAGAATDFDRPLTDLGHQHAKALATILTGRIDPPTVIMTSPFVRAVQTAAPLALTMTPDRPTVINDELRLESLRPKKLAASISTSGLTILVGHQPDLGQFAGWLLGTGPDAIDFAKGAAALIACGSLPRKGRGELRWLLTPDWFGGPAAQV